MSKEIEEHVLRLYEPKKLMGSGAYGHVWRAIDRQTKQSFALKKIFDAFQNSTDAQRTYRELTLLGQLDHPHIVKLHKAIRAKNNRDLYLVFELVEADLHSLVGEQILEHSHIRFVCSQLLRALSYLHSAQLIHRDLKPSNVLINSDCHSNCPLN
jgi:mitogen-activated protein kinase 15